MMKTDKLYKKIVEFIRIQFNTDEFIPLHAPVFRGREKEYLIDCINTGYVSSVGSYVTKFEKMCCDYVGISYAVATVNGTSALHTALHMLDVSSEDEVLTQPLSFVATSNAIKYCGAVPVYVDVEKETFGMSPDSLSIFLKKYAEIDKQGNCINKSTGRKIKVCIPVHVFGHPVRIYDIVEICKDYRIYVVEDCAESIGSTVRGVHTGRFGKIGAFSFNGNKTITTGGGGMLVTDDEELATRAKHITTTAKTPHKWEYIHDETGFNYRLPNINAALGCAQMEELPKYIDNKRELAKAYKDFFNDTEIDYFEEKQGYKSNYWLNAIIMKNESDRDEFLQYSNDKGVMTRPLWRLNNKLKMYENCQHGSLDNAEWLESRVVNIPSSPRF